MCHQSASSGSDETLRDEIARKTELIRRRYLDRQTGSTSAQTTPRPVRDLGSAAEVFTALRDNFEWTERDPSDDDFMPSDYQTLKTDPTD